MLVWTRVVRLPLSLMCLKARNLSMRLPLVVWKDLHCTGRCRTMMRPRRNVGLRTRLRCVLKICPMLYTCAFAKVTRAKGYDGRCVLLVDIVNGTV